MVGTLIRLDDMKCFVCKKKPQLGQKYLHINVTELFPIKDPGKKNKWRDEWYFTFPDYILICNKHKETFDKILEKLKNECQTDNT